MSNQFCATDISAERPRLTKSSSLVTKSSSELESIAMEEECLLPFLAGWLVSETSGVETVLEMPRRIQIRSLM